MGNRGEGVSIAELGSNRWKLRWRQRGVDGAWKSKSMNVTGSTLERDKLVVEIREALEQRGRYDPEVSDVLEDARPADLEDLLTACVESRKAAGKYRGKTADTYTAYSIRFLSRIRELEEIADDDPVPVTVLSRDLFTRIQALDRARGSSTMMGYAPLRLAVDAWRWAHDGNAEAAEAGRPQPWPRLPPSPRNPKDYLPRVPKYGRTIAPSLAHIDSVIRRLWARDKVDHGTKIAALVLRYTGLRSEQVFSILREDVDLDGRSLYVRTGKTEQEKADARTVPLSKHLLDERGFVAWVESFGQGLPIFPKRRHAWTLEDGSSRKRPVVTFKMIWEEATEAGDVPRHVWAPPNRRITRPEHSFRAAFQAHLEEQRVPGNVIDFLVGHEDGSVQDMHYGRDLLATAREAVDAIPLVDWTGPATSLPANVLPIDRRA